MSEAANTPEGQMLEGRYRIVRKIADGGMATVYEALDTRLERTVAIKIMHTQLAQGPHRAQFVERFHREAKSAAAIANPHIVQVYDTGEVNGLDFLVMEFVHGVNLRHEMNQQGTFTVRETLRIVAETLDGLASAHRAGVVHRDIKPENILLNDRGHVQITDFGLAKAASQATLSSTGMLLGTAAYLAPEMIELNQATPQGDLYSVGIMAWEMLAGEVPFVSDNPVTLVFKHVHEDVPSVAIPCPGIDPKVAAFIAHLTARAVESRPDNAIVAAQELRGLSANLDIAAWTYRKPAKDDGHDTLAVPVSGVAALAGVAPEGGTAGQAPADITMTPPAPPAADPSENNSPTSRMPGVATAAVPSANTPAPAATDSASPATGPNATSIMPLAATTTLPSISNDGTADADGVADSAATQVFAAVDDAPARNMTARHAQVAPNAGDGATRKRSRKPLIIALVTILVLALAGGGTWSWWYYLGPGSYWSVPQPDDVACKENTVCGLAGADWDTYSRTLKVSGIPFKTSKQYSDDVAEGAVISADHNVGDHISKRGNDSISVVISQGVKQATMPDDILDATSNNGKNVLEALKTAGFDNVTHDDSQDEYSETLPQGAAISIDGANPGDTVAHNTAITVVLSKGPMPVEMPDIVGKTQDEMKSAFAELKLTANITEQYDDKIPAGQVISASQDAGTQLHWGDSVDVTVSKGPETVTLENYVGKKASDAKSALEKLGFTVNVKSQITLDSSKDKTVASQDPVGGTVQRIRDENGNKNTITLTMYSSLL